MGQKNGNCAQATRLLPELRRHTPYPSPQSQRLNSIGRRLLHPSSPHPTVCQPPHCLAAAHCASFSPAEHPTSASASSPPLPPRFVITRSKQRRGLLHPLPPPSSFLRPLA